MSKEWVPRKLGIYFLQGINEISGVLIWTEIGAIWLVSDSQVLQNTSNMSWEQWDYIYWWFGVSSMKIRKATAVTRRARERWLYCAQPVQFDL